MSVSSAAASPIAPRARFARASSSSRGDAAVRRVSSDPSTSTARGSARTSGWGKRRGAIPPDSDLLLDPDTHGYCVYSHADWSYAYKSVVGEIDYPSCRVEGEIPDAIRGGVLYRAGPALFERGGVEYKHMLDGDGMVLRFAFGESQAQAPSSPPAPSSSACAFTSRFVRTTEFRAEEAADAVVYRGTFGTMRAGGFAANALDLHQKNLANTNILAWGDRVYALYEAGRPVALDPVTLDAAGEDDLDGKLPPGMFVSAGAPPALERALGLGGVAFTAHPHVDSHTARAVGWGWKSLVANRAVEATFWEWAEDWSEPTTPTTYRLAGCEAAPHDFAVTRSWYVLVQNCLRVNPGPYLAGLKGAGECLVSQPEDPVTVHLVPRPDSGFDGGALVSGRAPAVAEGPRASFEIHVAFAHDGPPIDAGEDVSEEEEKGWVTFYTAGWDALAPGSFLGEWAASDEWDFPTATKLSPDFNNIPRTLLWRYRVEVATGKVHREPAPGCENLCIDHPHVNPLFEGRRECRYVYASLSNEVGRSGPPLGYVRVDLRTGETQKWWAGNRSFCEEVVIVPKDGARVGDDDAAPERAKEEECWILGMIADHSEGGEGKSSLVILDGANLAAGPVARVWLEHRIPHGLHGAFVHAERT